ncbi:trypsin-like peptidase domain-containing protein [Idiomarina xiamenensis]|uniref:Serine protease n=1 Tax=Idiomarina xiamenensis 10-D-4 TaxID=740709 RepID=K2KSH9_9GAMM|nr:trypsin-like peptidase domain-containing protein [Idiomarina xiamenensis]EKE85364.1 serine protease [Idiomarina xiamenensis 10-D-4]
MQLKPIFNFLAQSILLGLLAAAVVLWLVPGIDLFDSKPALSEQTPATYAQAVNRAAPAVVNIYSAGEIRGSFYNPSPSTIWRLGSGVIMDQRGYILTAYHVVADVDQIEVALQDGRAYAAQLIGSDRYTDIAVLRIQAENLPTITVNPERNPRVGDVVLAIGNPYNLGQTVTQGIISATGGRMGISNSYSDLIQMDASINEGASGGALVNSLGELIGINNASYQSLTGEGGEGIYFAVPYPIAAKVMKKIISDGAVVRGYMGIKVDPSYDTKRSIDGVIVNGIDAGGPADKAGLRVGDYIVEMAGQAITTGADGLDLVAEAAPGTRMPVVFYRNNQRKTTTVVIGELPQ